MKIVDPFLARKGTPVTPGVGRRLSIDPGVRGTGWALWSTTGFLLACGLHEPPFHADVTRVVIEMPQTYPNSPVPYQDLVTLGFLAGRYIGASQACGFPVEAKWCFPHEWGGTMPKDVKERRIRRKLNPDERLVLEGCERLVAKGLLNNTIDAIGIGLYTYRDGI